MRSRTVKPKATPKVAKKPTSAKHAKMGVSIAVAPMTHGDDNLTDNKPDHMEVDGGKARQRLDRPRRKAFAGGGEVRGPTPSLKQATNGMKVNHPAFNVRSRLDRPSRKRYADGGDVTDGLQQFRNIERAFASNDDGASAPPLRSLSNDSARLANLPLPVQKSADVVPTVDPLQSLQRTQQIIAHGLPRGFAKGGKIRSPKG
jgi:hypothetical protein